MNDAALAALRRDLAACGFTVDGLAEAWGAVADAALARDDVEPALIALDTLQPTALRTLGRLFILGGTVSEAAVEQALPALGVQGAEELGLIARHGGAVTALVELRPYAVADEQGVSSWWILADPGPARTDGELPEDHVLGVARASRTLAGVLVPAGSGSVLDLGTGSGIQALLAARTASMVVATDVSPRALDFTRRTAAVNGVEVEVRLGSLYEPVAGERFDRIVSNPPFVITPRDSADVPSYTYRDGGLRGDGLVEAVVRGAADHLVPGGIAQLLANWEVHGDAAAARERVLDWAEGLDVWIVERDVVDPAQYAEAWVRDGGTRQGGARWRTLIRAWLDDFAARGVTAVAAGHITVRLPEHGRPTLRRFERLGGPLGGGVGAAIAAGLAAHDLLLTVDDAALARRVLRIAPDVTERRHYWPGEADPTVIELVQGGGFARVRRVDTVTAAVAGACDGELPVGDLIDAVARLLDADAAETRASVLPVLRELLVEGFLHA